MYELCIDNGQCCVCRDKQCLSNNSSLYHKRYHGSKVYTYKQSWWDFWRPSLMRAAQKSLRSAIAMEARIAKHESYVREVRSRVELVQKEPLVDAMLKSQGQ